MKRTIVVGVMGGGASASDRDLEVANRLGCFIASKGWITLSGGRDAGVMAAVNRGARSAGGLTVGIHPGSDRSLSPESVVVPILSGLGNARNNLNVLSSDIVVGVGFRLGPGTISELALAAKAGRPLALITDVPVTREFFAALAGDSIILCTGYDDLTAFLERITKEILSDDQLLKITVY